MRLQEIAKYFDNRSATYDKERVAFREETANLIAKLTKPSKDDVILDMGTGTGYMILKLAKKAKRVIGIDISKKMLEIARRNVRKEGLDNAVVAFGSFENPSATIDLKNLGITKIISNCAMHYMADTAKKAAILNMIELLNGDGSIFIGDKMIFDDVQPENYNDIYHKGRDFIPKVDFLVNIFEKRGFDVKTHKVHPLVGVIEATFVENV